MSWAEIKKAINSNLSKPLDKLIDDRCDEIIEKMGESKGGMQIDAVQTKGNLIPYPALMDFYCTRGTSICEGKYLYYYNQTSTNYYAIFRLDMTSGKSVQISSTFDYQYCPTVMAIDGDYLYCIGVPIDSSVSSYGAKSLWRIRKDADTQQTRENYLSLPVNWYFRMGCGALLGRKLHLYSNGSSYLYNGGNNYHIVIDLDTKEVTEGESFHVYPNDSAITIGEYMYISKSTTDGDGRGIYKYDGNTYEKVTSEYSTAGIPIVKGKGNTLIYSNIYVLDLDVYNRVHNSKLSIDYVLGTSYANPRIVKGYYYDEDIDVEYIASLSSGRGSGSSYSYRTSLLKAIINDNIETYICYIRYRTGSSSSDALTERYYQTKYSFYAKKGATLLYNKDKCYVISPTGRIHIKDVLDEDGLWNILSISESTVDTTDVIPVTILQ